MAVVVPDVPTASLTVGNVIQGHTATTQYIEPNSDGSVPTAPVSPYPAGSTPITAASGDVAATNAVATLAKATGKTTYITGFSITSTGATGAATVDVTVVGVVTGTLTFTYAAVAGATLTNTPLNITFPYPIPSSATNTDIVVTLPSLGTGNLHAAVNAYGFRL